MSMSAPNEHGVDAIRQAIQEHINEAGAGVDNGGWLVTHYVAMAGLYRVLEDGSVETRPILASPTAQAGYVTYGLLAEAPELLAQIKAIDDEVDCEETDTWE